MSNPKTLQLLKGQWLAEDESCTVTFHKIAEGDEWNPMGIQRKGEYSKTYTYEVYGTFPDFVLRYKDGEGAEMQMPLTFRGNKMLLPIDGESRTFRKN